MVPPATDRGSSSHSASKQADGTLRRAWVAAAPSMVMARPVAARGVRIGAMPAVISWSLVAAEGAAAAGEVFEAVEQDHPGARDEQRVGQ